MSRKYRQRGYMDQDFEGRRRERVDDLKRQVPISSVVKILKCANCGERNETVTRIKPASQCNRCGAALHSCAHCEFLDYKARFQCSRPIASAIEEKDKENQCEHFSPKYERDASLNRPMTEEEARKALDRLFKL